MTFRARAELRLASSSDNALAMLDLKPDPLTPFVRVLSDLRDDEQAEVILDLLPLSRGQRRRSLRKGTRGAAGGDLWTALRQQFTGLSLSDDPLKSVQHRSAQRVSDAQPTNPLARLELRATERHRHSKLSTPEAAFAAQVLVWAETPDRARSRAIVSRLVAAFATFDDRNYWRVVGTSLPFRHVLGADFFIYRAGFDRRARLGWFAPRARSVVTASEIAGLITPPSIHCASSSVARSSGLVPPAPPELPLWTPETPGLLPLGRVDGPHGEQTVGVRFAGSFHTLSVGETRSGKSETGIVRFLAASQNTSQAALYLDPHADAINRLRPYLTAQAGRVLEVDLSRAKAATQAGWNPLSMEGAEAADIGSRVETVASAFSTVLGWTERNNRALNLVSQATQSLCELALHLPPGLHPTLFQISTLLSDEEWRSEVMPYLSPSSRAFWDKRFSKQTGGGEAITPTTNLLDRLRLSQHIAAMFGQSRSSFNLRSALDEAKIILLCPGGTGDKESLIHALFLFELHRAVASRIDIPLDQRVLVQAWLDELQIADRGQGSVLLCRMLQEGGKFGLRLHAMLQQPTSLQRETLSALFTNASHTFSNTLGHDDAVPMSRQWGSKVVSPETISLLPQYTYLACVRLNGEKTKPFKVRGLSVEEAWGEPASAAEVAKMERTIDRTMARRPVADVLAELDTLDERILDYLDSRPYQPLRSVPDPVFVGRRPRVGHSVIDTCPVKPGA